MDVIVPVLLLLLAASTAAAWKKPVPAMFVFGDSQLDAGNNFYIRNTTAAVNFPPYGETYFHKPTGRFTNGRTIADFLALYMKLPLVPPSLQPGASYKQGLNFASGGSGLLESTSFGEAVLPMSTQIRQFQKVVEAVKKDLGNAAAQELLSRSLYLVASGSNDFGINYLQNTTLQQTTSPQQFTAQLMSKYTDAILALYQAGARKLVVFEVGLLGCTPSARLAASLNNQTGCLVPANQLALLFNGALTKLVDQLRVKLPDLKIAYAKSFAVFTSITSNASSYGFLTTSAACCGAGPFNAAIGCGRPVPAGYPFRAFTGKAPSRFLFWDTSHPTEATYSIVFKRFWSGDMSSITPMNLRTLVSS